MANSTLILAPGETAAVGEKFSPSLSLFWLQTQVAMTNRRIVWKAPNTVLGVLPAGYAEHSMPVGAVASATVNVKFHVGRAILGALLVLFGFIVIGNSVLLGLLLLVLGFLPLANSATADLSITNNGGGAQNMSVSILEKDKLERFTRAINEILYSGGAGGGYGATPQAPGYGAYPAPHAGPAQHPGQTPAPGSGPLPTSTPLPPTGPQHPSA